MADEINFLELALLLMFSGFSVSGAILLYIGKRVFLIPAVAMIITDKLHTAVLFGFEGTIKIVAGVLSGLLWGAIFFAARKHLPMQSTNRVE